MKKRMVSLSVALSMLLNLTAALPTNVFASDISDQDTKKVTEWQGHRYQIIDTSMYWKDAKEYCESLGGHLVTITDEEEKNL
jgi:hypothetical protein